MSFVAFYRIRIYELIILNHSYIIDFDEKD